MTSKAKTKLLAPVSHARIQKKQQDYFPEMLNFLLARARHVLDVGCGSDVFGHALKETFECKVLGVDPIGNLLRRLYLGWTKSCAIHLDEEIGLPFEYFDCIFL